MKKRIWELDAIRGLCIIGMVIVHFMYDLVELYSIIDLQYPAWFTFIWKCGSIAFILLSGICVTLGSRSVRRGLIVFSCGMVITAVTYGMYYFGMTGKSIIIYFGVLHCLGVCMLLWPIFRKQHWISLLSLGAALIAFGFVFRDIRVETQWLMPLGLIWDGFASSDYFPLLPNLGYFLAGAAIGRTAYRRKESLLPNINAEKGVLAFLQWCGRQSLTIYLLHQPILSGICWLIMLID